MPHSSCPYSALLAGLAAAVERGRTQHSRTVASHHKEVKALVFFISTRGWERGEEEGGLGKARTTMMTGGGGERRNYRLTRRTRVNIQSSSILLCNHTMVTDGGKEQHSQARTEDERELLKKKNSRNVRRITCRHNMTFSSDGETLFLHGRVPDMELKPMVCLVCGRASNTGHHYGVTACLGCKTFFRRVVLQGTQPKCKFQNKCLLVKGIVTTLDRIGEACPLNRSRSKPPNPEALHPCRDLIGRRQPSQSDSISPSDSPSSSSSSGVLKGKLSPTSEEALCFLYGLRDMDAQIRRNYAARRGHCVVGPEQDRFFYNPICDFSDVAPNDDLSQSIRGDIAIATEWAEQVPSFHLLSPSLRSQAYCNWTHTILKRRHIAQHCHVVVVMRQNV
ncbi:zinc finger, C4 type [Dictyocaulus viviparus]|uniref:Zinc finger, C4 type n=1 Tax=Dictyocaulus viviparus TaxID=29172 RepID=A0A0D8XFB1_DICVI|nr:zinc finger, C4 type [Dictyocaulus viviparus]